MVTRVPHHSTRPRRRLRLLLASGVAALALTAGSVVPGNLLAPAPSEARADDGKTTLTVAVAQSVDSLSPFLAQRLLSTSVLRLMYDFLTNYDPKDNKAIPGLATAWEPSADKLTWTYTIRSDSKWSDGQQATAEDAAWTFNKMMTDEAAATSNGSFVGNFEKVTAPSKDKLVITLKEPQATMAALDVPIVPKHLWEKVGDFSKFNNDKEFPIVGNGPFIVTDYKVDSYVKLKANKDFWRGSPKFDELVFRYYKDQDAAVAALRKGEVSFVAGSPSLTPAQSASLENAPDIKVNDAPGRRFFALAVNPGARTKDGQKFGDGHPALLDQKVRHALFMAVDRKTIIDKVFQGHAVEGEGYIPPRFGDYFWKPSADQKLAYDPARAGSLLDEAGYKKNGAGKRVGKDGKPLDFRILCHATDPNDKAIGKYLQEWWGEQGIGLKVDCLDNVSDPWYAGEYDLAFDGWSVNPDPDFVLSIHTCDALPHEGEGDGLDRQLHLRQAVRRALQEATGRVRPRQAGGSGQATGVTAVRHRVHERHGVPECRRGLPHRPHRVHHHHAVGRGQHLRPGRLLELVVGGPGRRGLLVRFLRLRWQLHRGAHRGRDRRRRPRRWRTPVRHASPLHRGRP